MTKHSLTQNGAIWKRIAAMRTHMTTAAVAMLACMTCVAVFALGAIVPAHASASDFVVKDGVLVKYKGDYSKSKTVKIPKTVREIGADVFEEDAIRKVIIPSSVKKIGYNAFGYSALKKVTFKGGVTAIESDAFYRTKLTAVTLPKSVKRIGVRAFAGCKKLADVTMGDNVVSIGSQAFERCTALKTVRLSETLSSMGGSAFRDCTALETVALPSSLKALTEEGEFYGCSKLSRIYVSSELGAVVWDDGAVAGVTGGDTVFSPFYQCKPSLTFCAKDAAASVFLRTYPARAGFQTDSVKLNYTSMTLSKGATLKLKLSGNPRADFTSSDKKVAKVSRNGKVTALKKGAAVVKVNVSGWTWKCKVTVK